MPTLLSFSLILLLGSLTLATDILHKKIRNAHLIMIATLAAISYGFFGITQQHIPSLQLWSTAVAAVIGIFLYSQRAWKGGDAKLFILYAAIMPATGYEQTFYLPAISLFANTFIAGLIFLTPSLLCLIYKHRYTMVRSTSKKESATFILKGIITIFCFSWITFPLLHHFDLTQHKALTFVIIYIISMSSYKFVEKLLLSPKFLLPVLFLGLVLHFRIDPDFFAWPRPLKYLVLIPTYALLAHITSKTIRYLAETKARIPFSPFLFLGCLLSYAPFLLWLSTLIYRR